LLLAVCHCRRRSTLGSTGGSAFREMGFTIEKATVTAKSRALKAEYSLELAQDLKAIHGLDAETELANILSRKSLLKSTVKLSVPSTLKLRLVACSPTSAIKGIFNLSTDADGRWSAEKFKGLVVQLIVKQTLSLKRLVVVRATWSSALPMLLLLGCFWYARLHSCYVDQPSS
jgi:hypothetical protein